MGSSPILVIGPVNGSLQTAYSHGFGSSLKNVVAQAVIPPGQRQAGGSVSLCGDYWDASNVYLEWSDYGLTAQLTFFPSWRSYYQARFTLPLKQQLFAIINRDMQAALNNVTGVVYTGMVGATPQPAGALPAIVSYHKAALAIEQFPALLLTTERQAFDREASQQARVSMVNFFISIAAAHQDPNAVADMLEQYFLALDQVLNSAWELTGGNDFYAANIPLPSPPFPPGAMSPGLKLGVLKGLFVADLAYDETKAVARNGFGRSGTMSLVCDLSET